MHVVFESQTFELQQKIRKRIQLSADEMETMSQNDFIQSIVDQIIEVGDELNTPIFRIANKFFIYDDGEPLHIPNKAFEEFLKWAGRQIGLSDIVVLDNSYRNQLFGCAWRRLVPDE